MNHLNPITTGEAILCIRLRNQSPAKLDPMADEDQPGYMPTVDVVRAVRDYFAASYLRRVAKHYVRRITRRHECSDALVNGLALEISCREILNANRRFAPTVRTR